jgi:hypothetical protein
VKLEGNRATVRTYVAATATPQDLLLPGTQVPARIHSFHVSGDSESVHDLDRLTPARSDGKGTMRIAFGQAQAPTSEPAFGFEATQTESAVRE